MSLKAIWVPDRKRILIDADEPKLKHRWNEAHQIGHSITPWHEAMLHGDHRLTLTLSCHHAVEAEANYAAGRLLFLQDRFADELLAAPVRWRQSKSSTRPSATRSRQRCGGLSST